MNGVRFWGTRGSLPVALTAADVRAKVIAALRSASGRVRVRRRSPPMWTASARSPAPSVATSCVEIETGGPDYVLCDLGSGVRPFGQKALARTVPPRRRPTTCSCRTCTGTLMGFRFTRPTSPGTVLIYGIRA